MPIQFQGQVSTTGRLTFRGEPPAAGLQATGGSVSYADGYTIHTFTSGGNFAVTTNSGDVEYLIVAGGGGGGVGATVNGGGGAGGVIFGSFPVTAGQTYPIFIGGGGAASTSGSNSYISTIAQAPGGGRGAGGTYTPPQFKSENWSPIYPEQGGSGGGGSAVSTWFQTEGSLSYVNTIPPGFPGGLGNNGGAAYDAGFSGSRAGGGGGGAGGVGYGTISGTGGIANGGIGIQTIISGTLNYYAGGGGGSIEINNNNYIGNTSGQGGLGGGGNGGNTPGPYHANGVFTAGAINTGGGGGATQAGGSGIIILRYPT